MWEHGIGKLNPFTSMYNRTDTIEDCAMQRIISGELNATGQSLQSFESLKEEKNLRNSRYDSKNIYFNLLFLQCFFCLYWLALISQALVVGFSFFTASLCTFIDSVFCCRKLLKSNRHRHRLRFRDRRLKFMANRLWIGEVHEVLFVDGEK